MFRLDFWHKRALDFLSTESRNPNYGGRKRSRSGEGAGVNTQFVKTRRSKRRWRAKRERAHPSFYPPRLLVPYPEERIRWGRWMDVIIRSMTLIISAPRQIWRPDLAQHEDNHEI